ncbi:MAG: DNA primase [Pseudomonadota bacterium]|nr:DNA primase [Pseudomonadota bacterium]
MAGRIPQDFLDHLLSRVDIVEVIDARVPLRKSGREYAACCPFHSEKTPSFTVSPVKQFYHCFGCGAHGTAVGFLMSYEHLNFVDAVDELARMAGLEVPRSGRPADAGQDDLLALVELAEGWFRRQLREHPQRHNAVEYLHRRGLSDEAIAAFAIGYAPPGWDGLLRALAGHATAAQLTAAGLATAGDNGRCHDRFRDRIVFPIRDRRGRCIAFGGRALGDATPKYLNSPETPFFHKGRELYGLYEARTSQRQLRRLLVVEGYMDVVALAQHGLPYAVATLGTATTAEHAARLFGITHDIVFCFDGDRAGREAAWRALENCLSLLKDGRQASFLFLPEGEDPDSLIRKEGREAFEQRLAQATSLPEYFFQRLTAQVDVNRLDGRARLVELARPLLERLPDGVFRDAMNQRLAATARVASTRLGAPPAPPNPERAKKNARLTRTPLRHAIALLLHQTALAQQAGDLGPLRGITEPGVALLVQVLDFFKNHPTTSVAALLERYRGGSEERILGLLARWQPPEGFSAQQLEKEFMDTLRHLENHYGLRNRLLEAMIQKGALSPEEEALWRNLNGPQNVKL